MHHHFYYSPQAPAAQPGTVRPVLSKMTWPVLWLTWSPSVTQVAPVKVIESPDPLTSELSPHTPATCTLRFWGSDNEASLSTPHLSSHTRPPCIFHAVNLYEPPSTCNKGASVEIQELLLSQLLFVLNQQRFSVKPYYIGLYMVYNLFMSEYSKAKAKVYHTYCFRVKT